MDKNTFVVDIFPDYEITHQFKSSLVTINREISNEQAKSIGKIISYVEGVNYHGDEYRRARNEQITATEFWNKTFLTKTPKVKELITEACKHLYKKYEHMKSSLVETKELSGKSGKKGGKRTVKSKKTKKATKNKSKSKSAKKKKTKTTKKKSKSSSKSTKKSTKKKAKKKTKKD